MRVVSVAREDSRNYSLTEIRTILDDAFLEAEETNDRELLAMALEALARHLVRKKRYGQAVGKLEVAAQLFRATGNSMVELRVLNALVECYTALEDDESVAFATARRELLLMPPNSPYQDIEVGSEDCNNRALEETKASVGGDRRFKNVRQKLSTPGHLSIKKASSERSFPSIRAILSGNSKLIPTAEQAEGDLREVWRHKKVLQLLMKPAKDSNESFLQRHLMQVQFRHLPFNNLRQKLCSIAIPSMSAIKDRIDHFCRSAQEFADSIKFKSPTENLSMEQSPGGLKDALQKWEDMIDSIAKTIESRLPRVQTEVLLPFARMKESYEMICDYYFDQSDTLEERLNEAERLASNKQKIIEKLMDRLNSATEKLVKSTRGFADLRTPNRRYSKEKMDVLSEQEDSEISALADNVENLKKAVMKAKNDSFSFEERRIAIEGSLRGTQSHACYELEAIDQARIAITLELMETLMRIQMETLNHCRHGSARVLESILLADPASDIRAICNRELIKFVTEGKTQPEALLCSSQERVAHEVETNSNAEFISRTLKQNIEEKAKESLYKYDEDSGLAEAQDELIKNSEIDDSKPPYPVMLNQAKAAVDSFISYVSRLNGNNENWKKGVKTENENIDAIVTKLCEQFRSRSIRDHFLFGLNNLRGKVTKVDEESMHHLVMLFVAFLDAVYIQGDIRAARMALMLAETFYSENSRTGPSEHSSTNKLEVCENLREVEESSKSPERFYIQDGIKQHSCWVSSHFWEESFYLAVRQEIYRNLTDSPESLTMPLSDSIYRNIAYAQLGSYAFAMLGVGRPMTQVKGFVTRMAVSNGLTSAEQQHLHENLISGSTKEGKLSEFSIYNSAAAL